MINYQNEMEQFSLTQKLKMKAAVIGAAAEHEFWILYLLIA